MRKIPVLHVLLLSAAATIFLYSCQKNPNADPPGSMVSSDDPARLSAAIKVWHGKRTTGTAPAPTGNNPRIDPTVNPTVFAFAGRYAIIQPEVMSGEIAGYYIGIAGAGQYFKIDFNSPRDIAGRTSIFGRRQPVLLRQGNADSSIVIVLPSNIQVPDTFCVTYCPYDAQGNIGQPVTTCIIVNSLGGDASSAWLQNDWRLTASWEMVNGQREWLDTIVYNKWTAYGGYICDTSSNTLLWIDDDPGAIVSDSLFYRKANLRIATNGAMDYTDDYSEKYVNDGLSTCSQFSFYPVDIWSYTILGGWSFNAASNRLILIFDFEVSGSPDPQVGEYTVQKINNNHMILQDSFGEYFIRFER